MDRFQGGLLRRSLRVELGPMLRLAGPVISAELGWMAMGVVDTIFVGRLGAEAIGAVSLGNALYFAVAIFGMGLLLGLDTLVSQAYGAGRTEECHDWLVQGLYLVAVIAPLAMLGLWAAIPLSDQLGLHPVVLAQAKPFLKALTWGTPALFLYAALRRYLQGMGVVKPIMFALVSANLVNAAADWVLIYGRLGFPAMGVTGSGWATAFSRCYMAGFLLVYVIYRDVRNQSGFLRARFAPRFGSIVRLLVIGLPAAVHVTLEVGVFAAATTLAGRLDPVSLAAHHVVLDVASVTFMIPLGLSSAGAVRVGQALGRGEPAAAGRAGWIAVILGAAFMTAAGLVMAAFPRALASLFTTDADVIAQAATLMIVASAFQLFDGLQGVSTGTMRGAGDTRTPVVCNLAAYWGVGLPLGYLLTFTAGHGVIGLWIGLATGLGASGIALLFAWNRKADALARGEFALAGAGVGAGH
ncbi:MAG: MATE family efflux transporter [Paludisphaera borealis]|uniref:MATE family efflux transporter n=1 Tax=Paludisphaera borealis TaxID=1387353 RepID=UPI00284CEC2B|nr:MATE family efflux transporter [Paludisphaera borealis]MDR3622615.1 MATE family efflux transporter [Paludisphaera borealis]